MLPFLGDDAEFKAGCGSSLYKKISGTARVEPTEFCLAQFLLSRGARCYDLHRVYFYVSC